MILVIDAGNSRIKWRLTDNGQIVAEGFQLTPKVLEDATLNLSDVKAPSEIRIASVAGEKLFIGLSINCSSNSPHPFVLRRCPQHLVS